MSVAISGGFIIITLLLVALLTFGTFLGTSTTQGESLREAAKVRAEQATGSISIKSLSTSDLPSATLVTGVVENPGAVSYGDFSDLDLMVSYTSTGGKVAKRLDHVCLQLCGSTGDPGDNQWSITNISPDSYNPKMWDPDETVDISLSLVPKVQTGTSATLVLGVSGGVTDSAYFTN